MNSRERCQDVTTCSLKWCGLLLFLLFLSSLSLSAQKQHLKQLEKKRKEALKEIDITSLLLKETRASSRTSLNRLELLTKQLNARKEVIDLLNSELLAIDQEVEELKGELQGMEHELTARRQKYGETLRLLHANRLSHHKWLFVLSADNFAHCFRRLRYLREYSSWQKQQAERIVEQQEEITLKQQLLQDTRTKKQALLASRESEKQQIVREEQEKRKEVQQLKEKQQQLQKKLAQKRRQADALNSQIDKLIAEDAVRSGKASGKRKAETKDGYAMTKAEQKLSSDFVANRGKLPFPLSGKYKIVSTFGEHQHQQLKHVRTNNNGIDIQTVAGTEARSIFHGEVTRVFVYPGFNNGVIVRHGNYLTVYINLSEVYVKRGDRVKTGQALGKIFTDTGNGNETILHFQVWKERTKLNPLRWIH